MADERLIDAYLADVAALLPRRCAARVVLEIEDHLRENVEHLMAEGRQRSEAERQATQAFGEPEVLATEFHNQGGAMPTPFTRWSGLAGIVATILFPVVLVYYDSQLEPGEDSGAVTPVLLLVPFALMVTGLFGLIARTHGAFGRIRGIAATVLIVAGIVLSPVSRGGLVAGVVVATLLIVGFGLLFDVIYREAVLPRPATALFVVSIVALSAMSPTPIEKQSLPYYVGFAALLAGWLWLEYTLWSERPERAPAAA